MRKLFNSCDIYVGGWFLYYLQGSLYSSGGIFSQSLLLCLLIISMYIFVKENIRGELPLFMKSVNMLLFMFALYGLWLMLWGKEIYINYEIVANFTYLKGVCISLLPVFVFYHCAKAGSLTEKRLRIYSLLFIVVTCFSFVYNYNKMLQEALLRGSSRTEFTNNVGYEFVMILPLLLYAWRKHILVQYLLLFVVSCFVFMAMKRGAILILCVCLVFFFAMFIKSLKGKRRLGALGLLLVACWIGGYYLFSFYENSDYFQTRMMATLEGNSSGRDNIYFGLFEAWTNFDFFSLIFGRGANATIDIVGNYAHNDWLELLINQGLLGVILYGIYFVCLYMEIKKAKDKDIKLPLLLIFLILFMSSLFSMSYNSISYGLSLSLGYCLYHNHILNQNIQRSEYGEIESYNSCLRNL